MNPTLFQQILGAEFFHLTPQVKALHARHGRFVYTGQATIVRGTGLLARLMAAVAGLPPAMQAAPTRVEFDTTPATEVWRRCFGSARMRSRMWMDGPLLAERLGPITFGFRLIRIGSELAWTVERARLFWLLPLPAAVFDGVQCRESEDGDGRYRFVVQAQLPIVGMLVRYEGWLLPEG